MNRPSDNAPPLSDDSNSPSLNDAQRALEFELLLMKAHAQQASAPDLTSAIREKLGELETTDGASPSATGLSWAKLDAIAQDASAEPEPAHSAASLRMASVAARGALPRKLKANSSSRQLCQAAGIAACIVIGFGVLVVSKVRDWDKAPPEKSQPAVTDRVDRMAVDDAPTSVVDSRDSAAALNDQLSSPDVYPDPSEEGDPPRGAVFGGGGRGSPSGSGTFIRDAAQTRDLNEDLRSVHVELGDPEVLPALAAQTPNLDSISLSIAVSSQGGMQALSDGDAELNALASFTLLRNLTLVGFSTQAFALIPTLPQLHSLSVSLSPQLDQKAGSDTALRFPALTEAQVYASRNFALGLLQSVDQLSSLTKMQFENNFLSVGDVPSLSNPSLSFIGFSKEPLIQTGVVESLSKLPNLKTLQFVGCPLIERSEFAAFATSNPECTIRIYAIAGEFGDPRSSTNFVFLRKQGEFFSLRDSSDLEAMPQGMSAIIVRLAEADGDLSERVKTLLSDLRASEVSEHVTRLDLSLMPEPDLETLEQTLAAMPKLKAVWLDSMTIMSLGNAAEIQDVTPQRTWVGDSALAIVAKTSAKALSLRGQLGVSKEAITELLALGQIVELDLSKCHSLKEEEVDAMRRSAPKCRIVWSAEDFSGIPPGYRIRPAEDSKQKSNAEQQREKSPTEQSSSGSEARPRRAFGRSSRTGSGGASGTGE